MDTQAATVIHLDQHRGTANWVHPGRQRRIWDALAGSERSQNGLDEVAALRLALLDHWAELHQLKCPCNLSGDTTCLSPLPAELHRWIDGERIDQKTV